MIILNIRLRKVERFLKIENYTTTEEAVQDIASIYANKDGTMVINNLQVNGKLTANSGKIGEWDIHKNTMGIDGNGTLFLGQDGMLRLLKFKSKGDYKNMGDIL